MLNCCPTITHHFQRFSRCEATELHCSDVPNPHHHYSAFGQIIPVLNILLFLHLLYLPPVPIVLHATVCCTPVVIAGYGGWF